MSVSRPKRARASVDHEEEPVSPMKSKQKRARSPSVSNGRGRPSRRSASPHSRQAKNLNEESGDESIDIVGVDQSSSSASVHSDSPKKPSKQTPSKNTKSSKASVSDADPPEEPILYCLVQHPVASTTPLPSVPASTCYKCNKKLTVPRPGAMSRLFGFVCIDCGKTNPNSRSWIDSVVTALLNLELNYGGQFFHHKDGICHFIDRNWDLVCGTRDRTATWWKTVLATITTRTEVFRSERFGSGRWALVQRLLDERKLTAPPSPSPEKKKKTTPKRLVKSEAAPEPTVTPKKPATPVKATTPRKNPRAAASSSSSAASSTPARAAEATPAPAAPAVDATTTGVITNTEPWEHPLLHDRTCHQCKVVKPLVISCDAYVPATAKLCLFKFCAICLEKYDDDIEKIAKAPSTWMCPSCRELCVCAQCKRARAMGTPPSVRLPRLKVGSGTSSASRPEKKKGRPSASYDSEDEDGFGDESLELADDDEEEDPLVDDDFDDFDDLEDDFDVFPGDDADPLARTRRPKPANGTPNDSKKKKKKPAKKKSINDWDIGRIVYNGRPESCNIVRPPVYEIHLPKFRVLPEPASPKKGAAPSPSKKSVTAASSNHKKPTSPSPKKASRGGKSRSKQAGSDEESESSSEDESDSAYTKRHLRAATLMRAQLFPGVDPSRTRV